MLYLAYGSNLHPQRLARRVPSARLEGTCHVRDFGLRFDKRGQDGSAKCTVRSSDEGLHGAVYRIDAEERRSLDRIEGLGRGYEEHRLAIPPFGDVFTYVAMVDHVDHDLLPFSWYRELVAIGARFHGFPAHYVRRIEAVVAIDDHDEVRHRQNSLLAGSLASGA